MFQHRFRAINTKNLKTRKGFGQPDTDITWTTAQIDDPAHTMLIINKTGKRINKILVRL